MSSNAVKAPAPADAKALELLVRGGQLAQAEARARALLAEFPDSSLCWNILGVALALSGRFDEALPALERTAALEPQDPEAHKAVADVLQKLGRNAEAEAPYRRAIERAPGQAELHLSLANVLSALGLRTEAEGSLRRAIELEPNNVTAHTNLGVVLRDLGRPAEAERSCRRALELKPNAFRALNNLGNALRDLGRAPEARECYQRAIERKPDYAVAHANLANVLSGLGQLSEAEASCRRALQLRPDDGATYNVLGTILQRATRLSEAKAAFERAVALSPRSAEAHNNLGNLLRELGEQQASEAELGAAVALDPRAFEAHSNLLFGMHQRRSGAAEMLAAARAYGRSVSATVARRFDTFRCEPEPRRLRVGLVSGDLREHVVAYFLEGVLAGLDRSRIEVIAYPTLVADDARAARLRALCDGWRPLVGLDDDAAASLIHQDGVHVLLDLAGHTAHNRLPVFARRPAPVQATWLGYFDTTGVDEMDWLLADEVSLPRAQWSRFTERIWYLPDTRLCFTAPEGAPAVAPLPAARNGHPTFGCFQDLAKLNDDVLDVFSRVFRALPSARLRVQSRQLGDPGVVAALRQRLSRRGIGAFELHGPGSRAAYLAAHGEVDILLDTFPYNGGTTTCEALWMGVPTVTLAGDDMIGLQGAALLSAAGLADWVAADADAYVRKAVAFASDLPALGALRASLRAQVEKSPLFDARRFAQNLEHALMGMWQARARG